MRDPTSCPWSPNSVCSVVDLNKFHIDRPEQGRTDIKVNGETLTMKGSGNLGLWTRSRAGAPVAWSDAPTDDTYTFEVDCRLVLGGGTLISVMSVYDGLDGACCQADHRRLVREHSRPRWYRLVPFEVWHSDGS